MALIGKFLAALFITALVLQAGCGFHLRGSSQIDPVLNPIHLLEDDLTASQKRQVINGLKRSGVRLASLSEASNQLRMSFSPLSERRVAGSGLSDVAVVTLSMKLAYSLADDSGQVLLADEMRQTRELQLDTNNVLAHDSQKSQVQSELEQALINAMMFQFKRL